MKSAFQESTPLTKEDCLLVFVRQNKEFDFPIHFHMEYELNCIIRASGAERIVGNHKSVISDLELVLVGPNVVHGWNSYQCNSENQVTEITIQFHRDLFSQELLHKKTFESIKHLLALSSRGISFSKESIQKIMPLLTQIAQYKGIESYVTLIQILQTLALEHDYAILSEKQNVYDDIQNRRIQMMYSYIEEHYKEKITLEQIADFMAMTVISFSRLIKNKTGKTFIEFLNDYRINIAIRLLQDSSKSISEITEDCGFCNQANFNRMFKQKTGLTPTEYKLHESEDDLLEVRS